MDSPLAEELTVRLTGLVRAARLEGDDPAADQCEEMMESARKLLQQAEAKQASVAHALQALKIAARRFQEMQAEFFAEAEEQMVDLAVEIAQKILAQEIDSERYRIDPIVREALAGVEGCTEITVRLNPDDLAHCSEATDDSEDGPNLEGLRLTPDPTVPRAGCRLDTSYGRVESTVEGQLDEVRKALKDSH